jgi:hypothetical protein
MKIFYDLSVQGDRYEVKIGVTLKEPIYETNFYIHGVTVKNLELIEEIWN